MPVTSIVYVAVATAVRDLADDAVAPSWHAALASAFATIHAASWPNCSPER